MDYNHEIENQRLTDPILFNSQQTDQQTVQLMCDSLQDAMQRLKTMGQRLRIASLDIQAAAQNVQAATQGIYCPIEQAKQITGEAIGSPENG